MTEEPASIVPNSSTAPLTVHSLRARGVDIPLDTPIKTASGIVGTSPVVLIDLQTEEGIQGAAYVFCYTPLVLAPLVRLVSEIGTVLRGADASPAAIARSLDARFRLLGRSGLVGMAIAGIDMALWDLRARVEGLPLHRLLGATATRVPAYAGIRSMQPLEAAGEALAAVEAGFRAVKVKLGLPTLEDDLALVRAVRGAIGADVGLMVDYNQSLTVPEALRCGRALDSQGIEWIEEPVHAQDDAGHAQVAAALRTPVAIGENWWGAGDMARSVAAQALDYATFDVARIGGVSGWMEAAALAGEARIPVSSHRYPEASAALLAATPTAHWLEYVDTVSPVLAHPLSVENGEAILPSEPGLGLAWDEAAVGRYLVE